jgi:hypothetical protein
MGSDAEVFRFWGAQPESSQALIRCFWCSKARFMHADRKAKAGAPGFAKGMADC